MKESDRLLFRENHFKFSRVKMILGLYWPALRFKFIALTVLAFLISIAIGVYSKVTGDSSPVGGYYLLSFMVVFSPLTIARRDFRDISSQLPVTASEKLASLVVLYWVLFPMCITVAEWVWEICVKGILDVEIYPKFYNFNVNDMPVLYICGLAQTASVILVILYTLVKARANRILSGIGAALLTYVGYMVLSGLCSFALGIRAGLQAARSGGNVENMVAEYTANYLPWILTILTAAALVVTVIFLVKLYKRLNNSGF